MIIIVSVDDSMVKVSVEIMDTFTVQRIIPFATVNEAGVPNVIYVGMWWWEDDETLCVVNNYLRKTLANVESNGWACFVCQGKNGSYQIKCKAENQMEGPLYEKARKRATERERPFPGKSVVVCKVVEVYRGSSGKGAGDKLA
jgi:predicted pyridoxine 5'-phosphate oxidase superfamily flavin-nucleotide-binding protein